MHHVNPQRLSRNAIVLFFLCILLLGTFLRLYYLFSLPLYDDEWHSLFRVQEWGYRNILTHFGLADHSIPLTLYNEWLSRHFVLNEWTMRLPAVLCGCLFIMMAFYALYRKNPLLALLFSLLLAGSPFLIYFSYTARPYTVSLLLSYTAIAAFIAYYKQREQNHPGYLLAFIYGFCAALSVWSLSISGFFVIAPFLYYLPQIRRSGQHKQVFINLLIPGLIFTIFFLILLGPPLYNAQSELTMKTGKGIPNIETLQLLGFIWFGTDKSILVILIWLLSLIGLILAWKKFLILRIAFLGCLLTLAAIFIVKPAYSFHAITFGRYMIFALPLILFASAYTMLILIEFIYAHFAKAFAHTSSAVLLSVFFLSYYHYSVLSKYIIDPDYIPGHSYYYFGPVKDKNPIYTMFGLTDPDLLTFWHKLPTPKDKEMRILVTPYYFDSSTWFEPLWLNATENTRIIPAVLNGFCLPNETLGEPWYNFLPKIKLNNIIYLADLKKRPKLLKEKKIDWLVWQIRQPGGDYLGDVSKCNAIMDKTFGKADYEDLFVKAWKITH